MLEPLGVEMLSLRERVLYHQIHPLKLGVDVGTCVISTTLLWRHALLLGAMVAFPPSIVVTALMVKRMDFRRERDSRLGQYVAFHMTRLAEAVRLGGQVVIWIGAWLHVPWAIVAGAFVILFGWTYSLPAWRARQRDVLAK